ncbi:diaminohydroxyphosphoribosylaminopyrimidine deaminase [Streptomyces sp. LaPpAH-199]|nr:diaminohydroxyphosphoribosylaminopyrimidine deaminase [Streptomyces sp. LaPpAH-199]
MNSSQSTAAPGIDRTANAADRNWLALACELAALCPPSTTAFSVGAVIIADDGTELARGYSRESDPHDHAEEGVLAKLSADDERLATATIYSSLEPCANRASRPRTCAQLIHDAGLRRVVTAWKEPDTFVAGAAGTEVLEGAGVSVIALAEYKNAAQAPNRHLLR